MANPPYSGLVIIIRENQDGFNARAWCFADVAEGSPIPKGIIGLEHSLSSGLDTVKVPPDSFAERNPTTRANLKTIFGQVVDAKFPDSP